jgi:hypothetical protein
LRPSGASIEIQVRYITSARRRSEVRDRLYRQVIGLFQKRATQTLHEVVCEPAGTQV